MMSIKDIEYKSIYDYIERDTDAIINDLTDETNNAELFLKVYGCLAYWSYEGNHYFYNDNGKKTYYEEIYGFKKN